MAATSSAKALAQAEAQTKAQVLVEALPYIRAFSGKNVVIKYGGSAMTSPELKRATALDLVLLKYVGINPILVHGGGSEISAFMDRLGKKPQFAGGLRVTDPETMEIVEMVLVGRINKEIVSLINFLGGRAVGLSGKDGNIIVARKRPPTPDGVDLGLVGEVDRINPDLLLKLGREGYIPVIASVAVGYEGESLNINADTVAGELAAALGADKLIMLTDVEGIYEDQKAPETLISALTLERARKLVAGGLVDGGMIPKLEACITAVEKGVPRAHIIDGRALHALLLEIFTDSGIGTMVVA